MNINVGFELQKIHNYNKDKVVGYVRSSECELGWASNPSLFLLRYCGVAIRFARVESDDYKSVTYRSTDKYLLSWMYDWAKDFVAVEIYQRNLNVLSSSKSWSCTPFDFGDSTVLLKNGFVKGPVFPDYVKFAVAEPWPLGPIGAISKAEAEGKALEKTKDKSSKLVKGEWLQQVPAMRDMLKFFFFKKSNASNQAIDVPTTSRAAMDVATTSNEDCIVSYQEEETEENKQCFKRNSSVRTTSLLERKRMTWMNNEEVAQLVIEGLVVLWEFYNGVHEVISF